MTQAGYISPKARATLQAYIKTYQTRVTNLYRTGSLSFQFWGPGRRAWVWGLGRPGRVQQLGVDKLPRSEEKPCELKVLLESASEGS